MLGFRPSSQSEEGMLDGDASPSGLRVHHWNGVVFSLFFFGLAQVAARLAGVSGIFLEQERGVGVRVGRTLQAISIA